jgi:2,5-dihydroxypyridine 5,6-dioxygenase
VRRTRQVVVRSGRDSELTLTLGDHRVNVSTGVHGSGGGFGGLEVWPGGQVSVVPDAGTAHGTLTITRSVNAPEFRELSEPIKITVREGYATDIRGGGEADRLRRWLESLDDPEATHLTELGIGTNALCEFAGVSAPCEDTHAQGCISFALGADVHLGGLTRSRCHVDMATGGATYVADGTTLVEAGELRLPSH